MKFIQPFYLIFLISSVSILCISGASADSVVKQIYSFEKRFKAPGTQTEFEVLASISGDRVQKRRLQMIHNESGIMCWVQFSLDFELAESSQVIRACIIYAPICKFVSFMNTQFSSEINSKRISILN